VVYDNGTLSVGQATLTVTAASVSRTYGTANPTFSASATGAVNGDTFSFAETTTATPASPVASYPIVPVAIGANLGNYTVVYDNGTLTVGQATLTVTAASASRPYGTANPTFSASAAGAVNGDTFSFAETTTATAASPVGSYPIVPVATGANLGDYTVVYDNGTLTVGQATLTVTAASASRTYGTANPTFSASATGAVNGDTFTFAETTTANATSPVGSYPIVPVATGANLGDYTVVYDNGTLTVGQATLTVTAASASRTYGTANPTFSASAAGAVNGDTFSFAETTTATPASPVGSYPIVPVATGANLGNYTVVYDNGTLTVSQATLTVTAASASRTYGTANPTFFASAVGAVNGDTFSFTETTTATPASPVGSYPIVPVATGANLGNYTVVYDNGTLTVGQATLTVTAASASRTYGTANPSFSASATGAVNGDTFSFAETTTATATSPVGSYPIVPVATGANLGNYTVVYDNGTLTVGQATLTVTAASASRTYGTANPSFSASAAGAVNGDTFSFTETTTATPASPVGSYAIVPVATGTNLADYTVVYDNGTLTVGQATLTVTAASASRTYGAANPTFSASATGAVNGDTFSFTETTTATPASPVGSYPIVPVATGANLSDYTVVYDNGTLTVGQATLTVTAASASRTYGTANPTFSASAAGSVNGDTFTFTESTSATPASPVGSYAIVPVATGANLGNYTVVYDNGVLTVGQATLTVTAANASRGYGAANPTFSASAAGAVNGDTFTLSESTPATTSSPIGTYPIASVATGTNLSDYTVVYVNGTLTVDQATLTVTADSFTKLYGNPNPIFTGSITGALGGDTFTEIFSNSASILSQPGQYPIIPAATGTNVTDYIQTVQDGMLTITKAPVIMTTNLSSNLIVSGLNVTMTTSVASTTSGTPTGTVNFFDNGTPLGTVVLSNGIATYSTTTLPVGTNVISTLYSGDINFTPSSASGASGSTTVNVTPLDFTFQVTSQPTLSGIYGTSGQYTLHIAPTGGSFPGDVQFTVTGEGPISSTYAFSPATVGKNGGPTDITFTLATHKLASLETPKDLSSKLSHVAFGLFLLPLLTLRYSRRSSKKLTRMLSHLALVLLSLGAISSLTGCGSGYFDHVYPITITATSNGIQHTVTVDYHIEALPQ
jgi:hypothetical protein